MRPSGRHGGHTLVEVETLWTVGERQPAQWTAQASFVRDVALDEHVQSASVATAMHTVNAVPAVCAAPAGFVTMADMPFVSNRHIASVG